MRTFCTIITSNYLPYGVTLFKSINKLSPEDSLYILICDDCIPENISKTHENIKIVYLHSIYNFNITDSLHHKYSNNHDALRWSMKPVFIQYLLESGYEKVIFVDCDIYFFNDYNFLFEELNSSGILLTPHWTIQNPAINEDEFLSFFNYGAYNAGFIGASAAGIPALKWWASSCLFAIRVDHINGLHNDQKYLDALPVLFDNVHIVRHMGCNVSFWNQTVCKRTMQGKNLLIQNRFPVIFIHFNRKYIPELMEGNDKEILPFYRIFESTFKESGYEIKHFIPDMPDYINFHPLIKLKRKLLLRTRIKRWLFKLSQR